MSSSAINQSVFQAKIGNVQNQADSSGVYSNGVWSFKNSTALTSVTITDSGNVGIGTASPVARLNIQSTAGWSSFNFGKGLYVSSAAGLTNPAIGISDSNGTNNWAINNSAGALNFSTMPAISDSTTTPGIRMTLDASGNLLVGQTNSGLYKVGIEAGALTGIRVRTSATNLTAVNTTGSGATFCYFQSDTTEMGKIVQNGASAVTYSTTSDYRLKKDVQPLVNALSRVSALKPCTYKWKVDDSQSEGFIAHELAEVCPEAVVGEKDAVNEDGSIKVQGIDPSKLVALLTAAIQEQQAQIETLRAEVAALKVQP